MTRREEYLEFVQGGRHITYLLVLSPVEMFWLIGYEDQFICSKGNLQVELLRDGTPEQIVAATRKLCEVSKGWKHIVSIADTIMAGTPPENLKLFADTVQGYK